MSVIILNDNKLVQRNIIDVSNPDLASLFQKIAKLRKGLYEPFSYFDPRYAGYNEVLSSIQQSASSKIWARATKPDDLWILSKLTVLLSDVSILFGGGGTRHRIEILAKPPEPFQITLPSDYFKTLRPPLIACVQYMEDKELNRWLKATKAFINSGQMIYLPERLLMSGTADGNFKADHIKQDLPFSIVEPVRYISSGPSVGLVTNVQDAPFEADALDILNIALPYLDHVPNGIYFKALAGEMEGVTLVRAAIRKALIETAGLASDDNPVKIRKQGIQIRSDIIDPELAKLTLVYKRLVETQALRAYGASLATVTLALCALSSENMAASIVQVTGTAGGIAYTVKEFAEYRNQLLSLKENPWYLLWKLRQRAKD
jgi:hypothetical protein